MQIERVEEVKMLFDSEIYSIEAIRNSAYDFTDRAWIFIEETNENKIHVSLKLKNSDSPLALIKDDFINNVLDHQVRVSVKNEFKAIREMIVAQAFEPCANLNDVLNNLIGGKGNV
jgi:His-Xaa-Ser system protein HxsD